MESFGTLIKRVRKARSLLLREVAAKLNVDPSFLSRIEGGTKQASREHVIQLAEILEADVNELLVAYLSDRIIYELQGEKLAMKAMSVAEEKIRYFANHPPIPINVTTKNEGH